jgi:hypothetical protein
VPSWNLSKSLKRKEKKTNQICQIELTHSLKHTLSFTDLDKLSLVHLIMVQWDSVITNSVVNKHSVITNRFSGQIGHILHKLTRLQRIKMAGPELFFITKFDCSSV